MIGSYVTDDKWEELREAFNNMNGAQRTMEERILLVHRHAQRGGCSVPQLCMQNGVDYKKYLTFASEEKLKQQAKEKGLNLKDTESVNVIEAVLQVQEKSGNETAQKVLDSFVGSAAQKRKAPSKIAIKQTLKPLLENDGPASETVVAETLSKISDVTRKVAKSGRIAKDYVTRFMEAVDIQDKIVKQTTVEAAMFAQKEKDKLVAKLLDFVAWLKSEQPNSN